MTKAYIPKSLTSDDRAIVYEVFTLGLLADLLIPFQAAKDREYQSHWAHRGLLGYRDGCILRQVDRIEPGINNLIEACEFDADGNIINMQESTLAAASLMDTLVDNVVYSLLGICLISAKFPQAGEAFKKKMLHRVMSGLDMADTDLDLYSTQADLTELAGEIARQYRAKAEGKQQLMVGGPTPESERIYKGR